MSSVAETVSFQRPCAGPADFAAAPREVGERHDGRRRAAPRRERDGVAARLPRYRCLVADGAVGPRAASRSTVEGRTSL